MNIICNLNISNRLFGFQTSWESLSIKMSYQYRDPQVNPYTYKMVLVLILKGALLSVMPHLYGCCLMSFTSHRALSPWEDRPANSKEADGLQTSWQHCLSNGFNVILTAWYNSYATIIIIEAAQCRADPRFATSQWETALLCNDVSHWLGANLESTLTVIADALVLVMVPGYLQLSWWHRPVEAY